MQLTRFTDYSLRVLMYLAIHHERRCTVKEIAGFYGVSQNHLVKVVHNLAQLGYIESSKGKGGGIRLLKAPEQMNLKDLVLELEPSLTLVECFDDTTNTCRIAGNCGLKGILQQAMNAMINHLGDYTVADTLPDFPGVSSPGKNESVSTVVPIIISNTITDQNKKKR
ncbi:MAG: Rrf2 family transcriptional regulator [Pseudohongiella nitratireducens]|nr:Rrf2 family transcriptional regulator [Pseudohongiella nitratireducens]MDF1623122.1 Rrf2 family transcriptional regulator [Pseudohongiella nitratireducens]